MKKLFVVLFSALSLSMSAQHIATINGAVGKNQTQDRVVLKMNLDSELTDIEKAQISQWSKDNVQFLNVQLDKQSFTIYTLVEKWDRNIVLKAFHLMNVEKVVGSNGKTVTPEEFLNSINL